MLTAKCKLYIYNRAGNSKPKRKQDIAPGDLAKLRECFGDPRTAEDTRRFPNGVVYNGV